MYDASSVVVDRKTSGSVYIERAAVSVLGSVQPRTLKRLFGNAERESGLLGRFLLVQPPEQLGLFTYKDLSDGAADGWRKIIDALVGMPPALNEDGTERPQYLPVHRDALPSFVRWHDDLKHELAAVEDEDLRAALSKLKGGCIRLALVLACIDAAMGEWVVCIGREPVRRAILIADWLKGEARRIYMMMGKSASDEITHELVTWVRQRGGEVTVRDLAYSGPRRFRGEDAARKALDLLKLDGLGDWFSPSPGPRGGRPTRVFRLKSAEAGCKTPDPDPVAGGCASASTSNTAKNADAEPSVEDPIFGPNIAHEHPGDDLPPEHIRFAGADEAAAEIEANPWAGMAVRDDDGLTAVEREERYRTEQQAQ